MMDKVLKLRIIMKNKIYIAAIFLIGSWSMVRADRRYMDTIRMGDNLRKKVVSVENDAKTSAHLIQEALKSFCPDNPKAAYISGKLAESGKRTRCAIEAPFWIYDAENTRFYWKESKNSKNMNNHTKALKRLRHTAWYTYKTESSLISPNTIAVATEWKVYPFIDSVVEDAVDTVTECEWVQGLTHHIPKKHRLFMDDNGKFVLGAAANRAWRVYADQGTDGFSGKKGEQNIQVFAQDASAQLGCAVAEKYIVEPVVKQVIDKDCFSKDLLSVGLNIAAYNAIISLVGK